MLPAEYIDRMKGLFKLPFTYFDKFVLVDIESVKSWFIRQVRQMGETVYLPMNMFLRVYTRLFARKCPVSLLSYVFGFPDRMSFEDSLASYISAHTVEFEGIEVLQVRQEKYLHFKTVSPASHSTPDSAQLWNELGLLPQGTTISVEELMSLSYRAYWKESILMQRGRTVLLECAKEMQGKFSYRQKEDVVEINRGESRKEDLRVLRVENVIEMDIVQEEEEEVRKEEESQMQVDQERRHLSFEQDISRLITQIASGSLAPLGKDDGYQKEVMVRIAEGVKKMYVVPMEEIQGEALFPRMRN